MNRLLPLGAALGLVVATGVVHGLASNRWKAVDPGPATGDVASLPRTVGLWVGRDMELDSRQLARGGIQAACARRYDRRTKGSSVQVLLVYGPSGPITVHTPDICYPGVGYEIVGALAAQRVTTGEPAEFRAVRVRKCEPGRVTYLRILWAWNVGNGWEAPDYPGLAFAQTPSLYKLYLVQELSAPDEPLLNDDCADFLREFLPGLNSVLFRCPE